MVGPESSFSEVHVLRALFLLDEGMMGRKKLVKLLGVGEGSVRTIIKRLSSDGLIKSSMRGHSLTESGQKFVAEKLKQMSKPQKMDLADFVNGVKSALIVYGASDRVGAGVALRDTALKAGADGAVILEYLKELVFAGEKMNLNEYPMSKKELESLEMSAGDVLVVGFSGIYEKAEDGAVAAALRLVNG